MLFVGFFTAMGSRECKPVWKTYEKFINLSCGYLISGHWRGRRIETFSRAERSVPEAARWRTREQAAPAGAARDAIASTRYVRTFSASSRKATSKRWSTLTEITFRFGFGTVAL